MFTKNRERLLGGDIAQAFFERVRAQAERRGLLSDEHFTVDGTLIEAWASLKSFQRKDAAPRRRTIRGTRPWIFTASGAATRPTPPRRIRRRLLYRKGGGREAKLCY